MPLRTPCQPDLETAKAAARSRVFQQNRSFFAGRRAVTSTRPERSRSGRFIRKQYELERSDRGYIGVIGTAIAGLTWPLWWSWVSTNAAHAVSQMTTPTWLWMIGVPAAIAGLITGALVTKAARSSVPAGWVVFAIAASLGLALVGHVSGSVTEYVSRTLMSSGNQLFLASSFVIPLAKLLRRE